MKRSAALTALFLLAAAASAQVEFSGLDLSTTGELLFQARAEVPGQGFHSTLFRAALPDGPMEQLTFYPEHVQFVGPGKEVQVHNRFGVFRSSGGPTTGLKPISGFPSFASGSQIQTGRLVLTQASPDGAWLVSLRPVSAAWSRMVLQEIATGSERVVSERVESSVTGIPAAWSPDSSFLAYSRAGKLYYLSMDQVRGRRVPEEAYRLLGPGTIDCARWSPSGRFWFIRDRNLYSADPREFFTRTLYSSILQTGTVAGEIPFAFDPVFDSWEISPDGDSVLLAKGGTSIFLYPLSKSVQSAALLPYLQLPSGSRIERILWPKGGDISVFASSIGASGRSTAVFRLSSSGSARLGQEVARTDLDGARDIALSPSLSKLAVAVKDGIEIRNAADFSLVAKLAAVDPLRVLWRDEGELLVAGSALIELVKADGSARRLVALSQADAWGFAVSGVAVSGVAVSGVAVSGADSTAAATGPIAVKNAAGAWTRAADGSWSPLAAFSVRAASTANYDWRVYSDTVASGAYRNTVMIRSVRGLKTSSLFLPPATGYDPFPAAEEKRPNGIFDHGSRLRSREVALTFDCMDGSEGLTQVLNTLADYGIRATFFLNGEFIRRHPADAAAIAAAGHETASLFFAAFNLTDASYRVDAEFIRRGLARNEDDFFAATGKELSALWHAPFYAVTSDMVEAARGLNYAYVGRDVDPMDWVSSRERYRYPGMFMDAADLVEQVVAKKKPGSIIPVRIGVPEGGRDDYLWQRLDILLNALIARGYSIVPVSTLMAHAE